MHQKHNLVHNSVLLFNPAGPGSDINDHTTIISPCLDQEKVPSKEYLAFN